VVVVYVVDLLVVFWVDLVIVVVIVVLLVQILFYQLCDLLGLLHGSGWVHEDVAGIDRGVVFSGLLGWGGAVAGLKGIGRGKGYGVLALVRLGDGSCWLCLGRICLDGSDRDGDKGSECMSMRTDGDTCASDGLHAGGGGWSSLRGLQELIDLAKKKWGQPLPFPR
jgi:hypothetical protein